MESPPVCSIFKPAVAKGFTRCCCARCHQGTSRWVEAVDRGVTSSIRGVGHTEGQQQPRVVLPRATGRSLSSAEPAVSDLPERAPASREQPPRDTPPQHTALPGTDAFEEEPHSAHGVLGQIPQSSSESSVPALRQHNPRGSAPAQQKRRLKGPQAH